MPKLLNALLTSDMVALKKNLTAGHGCLEVDYMRREAMNRQKNILVILLLCFVLELSSCASDKASISETRNAASTASQSSTWSNGDYVKQETGNVKIDASVIAPDLTEAPVILAEPFIVDKKTAESLLFQNEEVLNRTDANNVYVLEGSNGSFLNIVESNNFMGNGFLGFGTSFSTCINNVFSWQKNVIINNTKEFSTETDLAFASQKSAIAKVEETLRQLGVKNLGAFTVYSLDNKTLKSEEEKIKTNPDYSAAIASGKMSFKDSWSEDDDCYFMFIECHLQGIPVTTDEVYFSKDDESLSGNLITVIYSKRGIEYLQFMNLYQEKSTEQMAQIITLDAAIAALTDKFASIITANNYVVSKIQLVYVPTLMGQTNKEFRMIPAWCFTTNEYGVLDQDKSAETDMNAKDETKELLTTYNILISAVDGKEII